MTSFQGYFNNISRNFDNFFLKKKGNHFCVAVGHLPGNKIMSMLGKPSYTPAPR